jgi:hypothetical protein
MYNFKYMQIEPMVLKNLSSVFLIIFQCLIGHYSIY